MVRRGHAPLPVTSRSAEPPIGEEVAKAPWTRAVRFMKFRDYEANEKQGLAASLEKLRTQTDSLRSECQTHKERAESARAECAAAQEAQAAAVAAGRQSESARQQEAKAKATAESELKQLRAAMD